MAHNEKDPHKKQQDIERAIDYTFQLLHNTPRFSRYYLKLAELLHSFPQSQNAISEKLQAMKLPLPGDSLTEQLLRRAQSLDPSSEAANIALALYYQQQKQPRHTLKILQQATKWFAQPKNMQSIQDQRKRAQLQKLIKQHIKKLQSEINQK